MISTERAMSLWLIDGHEKGGLSDCFAGVFHTSRYLIINLGIKGYLDNSFFSP
jgi:hypothetical protein